MAKIIDFGATESVIKKYIAKDIQIYANDLVQIQTSEAVSCNNIYQYADYSFNATDPSIDTIFSVVSLTSTTALILFKDSLATNYLRGVVATVASDNSITYGTIQTVYTNSAGSVDAVRLDATRVLCAYEDVAGSGQIVVLSISGTTITLNTPVLFNSGGTNFLDLALIGTDKAILSYQDVGNSSYGTSRIITVSGTVPTPNAEYVWSGTSVAQIQKASVISTDRVAITYNNTTATSMVVALLNVSSTTIAAVNANSYPALLVNNNITIYDAISLQNRQVLVSYYDATATEQRFMLYSANDARAEILDVVDVTQLMRNTNLSKLTSNSFIATGCFDTAGDDESVVVQIFQTRNNKIETINEMKQINNDTKTVATHRFDVLQKDANAKIILASINATTIESVAQILELPSVADGVAISDENANREVAISLF